MCDAIGEQDAGQPTGARQKHAFGQKLPHQAHPAGAHRKTNGNFPPPLAAASQQQAGQVGAHQREDQRPQHHVEGVDELVLLRCGVTNGAGRHQPHHPAFGIAGVPGSGFLVDIARHAIESGFRRGQSHTIRQPEHDAKNLAVAAMERIAAQLGSQGNAASHGHKQIRRSLRPDTQKILGSDAHDGGHRTIQPQLASHGVRVRAQVSAPEAVAHHHHGRHPGLLRFRSENPSCGRCHPQGGEVLGRNQVSGNPLRPRALVPCETHRERHWPQNSRGCGYRLAGIPVALEIGVGNLGPKESRQRRGVAQARSRPYNGPALAHNRAAHPNAEAERKHSHRGKPGRLGQHPQRIHYVLPNLGEILGGQPDGKIGQQPHQAEQAVPAPGFRSGVFTQTLEILAIQDSEFVRIRIRQTAIQGQADIQPGVHHQASCRRFFCTMRTISCIRSHSSSSTVRPSRVSL